MQHKKLDDPLVASLSGADDDSGVDVYVAASKLHLGAIAGYNWFWNITARATDANQTGLLGFGHTDGRMGAGSVNSDSVKPAQQNPDNLGTQEDAWQNIFVA